MEEGNRLRPAEPMWCNSTYMFFISSSMGTEQAATSTSYEGGLHLQRAKAMGEDCNELWRGGNGNELGT